MARTEAQEIARLRSENTRLQADVSRYRKSQRFGPEPTKPAAPPRPSFELVDPRRKPQTGTKVLPEFTPQLRIGREMAAAVIAELKAMALEARDLIRALQEKPGSAAQLAAMDAISDDAQHQIKALKYKWQKRFDSLATLWSDRMIASVLSQSDAQLNLNLRDIADRTVIQSTLATPRMRAILEASSQSSVGLITRIPERFLGSVQTAVMNSITTGSGLADLVPYLTKKYQGDARHARFVALDQVRKVSENVNATRLQSLGVEEYVWIHTAGERYPRKLHMSYSGKTFR